MEKHRQYEYQDAMPKSRGITQKYASQMQIVTCLSLVSKFPTFLGLRFHGEKKTYITR